MRATVLAPLILLGWYLLAIGQSPAPSPGGQPSLKAQSPTAAENELKLVVALFRHGVRAPLPGFAPPMADKYSGQGWPTIAEWNVPPDRSWGDLTTRGRVLATALGSYYADWYRKKNAWPEGFKVYLWADTDQRTVDTADALAQGFEQSRIPKQDVTVRCLSTNLAAKNVDPLFHPFQAGCGTPDQNTLATTVAKIEKGRKQAAQKLKSSFEDLYGDANRRSPGAECLMRYLHFPGEHAPSVQAVTLSTTSLSGLQGGALQSRTGIREQHGAEPPGQFPYASSASEAFLQGSNLIREIRDLLRRTAETVEPIDFNCLRADKASQFVGLVGHDTNIAGVGELLQLSWQFADAHLPPGEHLPPDTSNLPRNDALPAGALVFELRQRAGKYFIRIEYVAQSLLQMRGDPKRPPEAPFRFNINCRDERGANLYPCEMSLDKFNQVVAKALGPDNPFLSRCSGDGNPVCP